MSGYGPPTHISQARSGAPSPGLIGYGAGALGVLSFVWGLLTWFTQSGQSAAGFSIVGGSAGAAVGLSMAAGGLAAAAAFERRDIGSAPAVLALAAFLVTLGTLLRKAPDGSDIGVGVGLVLELITTALQVLGVGYLWLHATGRLPERRASTGGPAGQHGQYAPPPGQFAPAPPPGGYQPAPQQHAPTEQYGGQQYGQQPQYQPQPYQPQPYQPQPYQPQQYGGEQYGGEQYGQPYQPQPSQPPQHDQPHEQPHTGPSAHQPTQVFGAMPSDAEDRPETPS